MKRLLMLVSTLTLYQVASSQDERTDDEWWDDYVAVGVDRFQFFNACQGMGYYVGISGNGSNDSALSESEIANAIESRLRAARIFDADSQKAEKSYFNVYLDLVGSAASLRIGFEKPGFEDPYSIHRFAQFPLGMETWTKSWLVQGGFRSGDVLAQLSKFLDDFIVNYLRVNSDEACEQHRVAKQIHKAKLEEERLAKRDERDAAAARWKGWSAEQCASLERPEDRASCSFDALFHSIEEKPE